MDPTQLLFDTAQKENNLEKAKKAIEAGANVNAKDKDGDTPLHLAVRFNDLGLVQLLLKNGADPTIKDMYGETPLDWAKTLKEKEIEKSIRNSKRI